MKRTITLGALSFIAATLCACDPPQKHQVAMSPPSVTVIHPQRGTVTRTITLPGDVTGYYQSALYAKVTGYLKSIYVDKGDSVKAGEVLAVIEVPELQEQLVRTQADLEVQRLTYQRLESVWKSDPRLVAREDVDIAYGKYLEAKARNDELRAMDSYTKIVAPFDGVVTERFVDPGALIHAGGQQSTTAPMQGSARPGGAAAPVVSITRLDRLRVYVYVPQGEVSYVHDGMPVTVSVQGLDGHRFAGTVARYAHSLDLATRTMLTEVDLENPQRKLYPGMYANVTLDLVKHRDTLTIPSAAVQTSGGLSTVFVVRQGQLANVPVSLGINNGSRVAITSGLTDKSLVVDTFSNALNPGEKVRFNVPASKSPLTHEARTSLAKAS